MRKIHELIDMKGRVVLITGGSGYIGKAITETVAELGADVVLLDNNEKALKNTCKEICNKFSVKADYINVDLEDENQVEGIEEELQSLQPRLDVLINNAAFVGSSASIGWNEKFEDQSIKIWRRAFEVNLTSAFHLSQKCYKMLRKSTNGSIINVASIYGVNGPDLSLYEGTSMNNPAAYSVSKGGLLQMTRWLSTVMAPEVRVNAISPGGVSRGQPDIFIERYNKRTPLGRMATEEDFKGAVAFLASDMSNYVTGQNILVDGGWGVW